MPQLIVPEIKILLTTFIKISLIGRKIEILLTEFSKRLLIMPEIKILPITKLAFCLARLSVGGSRKFAS